MFKQLSRCINQVGGYTPGRFSRLLQFSTNKILCSDRHPGRYRTLATSSSSFVTPESKNNDTSHINNLWLRENCQCKECYTHETNQRNVLFHRFDIQNIQPVKVKQSDGAMNITWNDGHKSVYSSEWLRNNVYPGQQPKLEKKLWDANELKETILPVVPYNDYLHDDEALKTMLKSLYIYGVGLVNQVPADIQGTQKVSERVCFIQETFFGRMWTFTADLARGDTAYTNMALGAHTDSTYLSCPPGIQVFHCLEHDGTGGETLLVDGFKCAERLRKKNKYYFNLLSKERIHHEYREPGVHTSSLDTILRVHPSTNELVQLRYNHYDRSPISTLPQDQVGNYYEALRELSEYIESEQQEYWIKLQPGTVIFVDNWRVMHGRSSFTGNRRVCGCYLPHDNWMSKTRTIGVL